MQNRSTGLLVVTVAFVVLMSMTVNSSQLDSKYDHVEAIETMRNFLHSWVIDQDEVETLRYFGKSAMGRFAPITGIDEDGRWKTSPKYWTMLNSVWPASEHRRDDRLEDVLVIDRDVITFITTELKGAIVHDDVFLVFAAHDDVGVNSFDAGVGDVADHLKPTPERPALMMIAGFREPKYPAAGPFVSFWGVDEDNSWRIKALGAYEKY